MPFRAVRVVTTDVRPRLYESDLRVELYVDAGLESGSSLAWWHEVRTGGGSQVTESSVLRATPQGQDEIRELPARDAVNVEELIAEVDGATDPLVASLDADEAGRL